MSIKDLRLRHNLSQKELAAELGINQSSLSQYETGTRGIDANTAKQIADIFGVSLDEIYGYRPANSKKPFLIPVLGEVRAGYPCEAVENILDYEEVPASMASLGELFALKIKGDSMEPKFSEGDVIIVQKTPDLESGSIGVVLVNGDAATCKKVFKKENGILLMPMNPAYDPMLFTWDEVESLPVVILGKVVELRAKFS